MRYRPLGGLRSHCRDRNVLDRRIADEARRLAMRQHQTKLKPALDTVDPVWARIRREAEDVVRREPELASFIYTSLLHHDSLEAAVVHRIAARLDHSDVSGELIRQAYA